MRLCSAVLLSMIFLTVCVASAANKKAARPSKAVSQWDFAGRLIKALDREHGLPPNPVEKDYLAVLNGKRVFKCEAEEFYNSKADNVSVRSFNLYGPFSGKGWVSGVTVPTTVHFKLLLPLDGDYVLTVNSKGDGQKWSAGDKSFTVNTGGGFHEEIAGTISLKAGVQEITLVLPPEGAVDYFTLSAPPLPSLEPSGGWHFKESLERLQFAEIVVQSLGLESAFPLLQEAKPIVKPVFGSIELPPSVTSSTANYFGQFSAKQWVRAGYKSVALEVPVQLEKDAVYDVKVHYLGESYSLLLDDTPFTGKGKPYFFWIDLGSRYLAKGNHQMLINLSPSDGVDIIQLEVKKSSPADFVAVAGLKGDPFAKIPESEIGALISNLVQRFNSRK